jgi:DNA-binding MarR family transcriptional regulator
LQPPKASFPEWPTPTRLAAVLSFSPHRPLAASRARPYAPADLLLSDQSLGTSARLAILTALAACRSCDFVYLQSLTAISKGNLSNHLQKLEDAGFLLTEKGFKGRFPQTTIRLTPRGRTAIDRQWRHLEELRNAANAWQPWHQPQEP